MIAKLELYFVVFLILAGAATGAYFYAKHQGVMEERTRWEAKAAAATKADLDSLTQAVQAGNKIAQDTADALKVKQAARVIDRGIIQREIQTNTVYAADCLPDTGRLQWNRISAGLPLMPVEPAGAGAGTAVPEGNGAANSGRQGGNAAPKPSGR